MYTFFTSCKCKIILRTSEQPKNVETNLLIIIVFLNDLFISSSKFSDKGLITQFWQETIIVPNLKTINPGRIWRSCQKDKQYWDLTSFFLDKLIYPQMTLQFHILIRDNNNVTNTLFLLSITTVLPQKREMRSCVNEL